MDNLTNKEPGIEDSTVQDSANKEQKKKESRPVIGAKAQTILEFLRACSPYEADSIRVMVGYGTGQGDIDTIRPTSRRWRKHGSTCNPNPPRTEGRTETKPERDVGCNRRGQGKFHSRHFTKTVANHSAVPFPYLR